MIGLVDSITLAYTKLRVHKVRTWISIAVSGVLFGLLLAIVVMSQGVFNSVESFSKEGFGDRYFISVNRSASGFIDWREDLPSEVVSDIEELYDKGVDERKAEAQRLGIPYNPSVDDPSPIAVDESSGKKKIDLKNSNHWAVRPVLERIADDKVEGFTPESLTEGYDVENVLSSESTISPSTGSVEYMKDGKEKLTVRDDMDMYRQEGGFGWADDYMNTLSVVDGELASPFIQEGVFDESKGEIPVLIPLGQAERLLGLEELANNASSSQKMERLKEVRSRIGEVSASFCYRNTTSQMMLSRAIVAKEEAEKNKDKSGWQEPAITYSVPDEESCGSVTVASDTRTAQEKLLDEKQTTFDKKFNGYADPVEYKIKVRAVGVMPSYDSMGSMTGMSGLISMMFGSYLGSTNWAIPADLLGRLAEDYRPAEIFAYKELVQARGHTTPDSFIVEFASDTEARKFMDEVGCTADCGSMDSIFTYPFGGSSMTVAEMKRILSDVLFWTVIVVSIIAAVVLAGTIGRTIAEGRRETAIFRAIGARRGDIVAVYTAYTLMLSFRIILFAVAFALASALAIQLWVGEDATVGAQLAFGVNDYSKQFTFAGFDTLYIPVILGVVVVACLVAMALPLVRNVRRNPINDMRDDA